MKIIHLFNTFAPFSSKLETMKSLLASIILAKNTAPEKKPSDRSNAGIEKKVHRAPLRIKNSAKSRQTFSHFCSVILNICFIFW